MLLPLEGEIDVKAGVLGLGIALIVIIVAVSSIFIGIGTAIAGAVLAIVLSLVDRNAPAPRLESELAKPVAPFPTGPKTGEKDHAGD